MNRPQPVAPQEVQRLRQGRLTVSIAACALTVAITLLLALGGYIPLGAALTYGAAVSLLCAAFYALFASGLNRKFADPSLTVPQLVAAGLAVSYAAYHGGEARAAFLVMYLMAFAIGAFTLRRRGLIAIAAFYFSCYAGVAALSLLWLPDLTDARREVFRLTIFGALLGWMAYMGSYIGDLRRSLQQTTQQLRDALEHAESLAQHDSLTGAFNRRHMSSLLTMEAARAKRGASLCLCLMDLDHFKAINDDHGHLAGDAVLKQFAATVQAQLRATDFLARYGGEEFLLALSQTALADAARIAERVRWIIASSSFAIVPAGRRVTVSIGVAQHRPGDPIDATLQRVDTALYEAKNTGRDRVVCAEEAAPR